MADHQRAAVEIVNHSGRALLSVSVSHKYSDSYKNHHTWKEDLKNGESTAAAKVDFNTGWLTTGRDWWVVTWVDDHGTTYVTDPKNGRDILDFAEKLGTKLTEPLATLAAAVMQGSPSPTAKGVAAAVVVTTTLAQALLNTEGTDGFKQHILREEDKGRPTRIVIKKDEVEFDSKSGKSTTGFRKL